MNAMACLVPKKSNNRLGKTIETFKALRLGKAFGLEILKI